MRAKYKEVEEADKEATREWEEAQKKENEAFLCMTDEECRLMLELYEKYNNALKNKFKEL